MTLDKNFTDNLFKGILKEISDNNINIFTNTLQIYNAIGYNFPEKEKFDISDFYIENNYKFESFIEGFVLTKLTNGVMNDNLIFLIQNSYFIQNHFEKIIIKNEGTSCSADKSSFILKKLYNYFLDGKEMDFSSFIDNKGMEYSYHIPKKIFTNQNNILIFFEALMYLYYGDGDRYILFISNIEENKIIQNNIS